jgi:NTE family protein
MPPSSPSLRAWLEQGPFGLALSSGYFGFFAHAGLAVALERHGFAPARLSGSSAGALVGGLWAAGLSAERIRDHLLSLRREDFWDPSPGLGLLAGRRFEALLAALLPVARFEDCRWKLAVSAFDALALRTRVLDSGPLVAALRASCSLPLLFQPAWDRGRPLWDGGVLDRPGLAGMPAGQRVLHHHLASRSPWRRRGSPALVPPRREGLVSLVIHGLPRSGPGRLHVGRPALLLAQAAAARALELPVRDGVVETGV